jgi:putative oxidoreductase
MARIIEIFRVLFGSLIFLSGLMNLGLFGFEPPEAGVGGRQFQLAMHDAGYFLPIITAVFIIAGISVVVNRYGALGSLLLVPVSGNILLFHSVLEGGQLPVAIILFAMNCFLLWYYRAAYRLLFKPRV